MVVVDTIFAEKAPGTFDRSVDVLTYELVPINVVVHSEKTEEISGKA